MADETFGNEVSKKKSTTQDILEYIPDWIPGVVQLREQKKRIEGTSTKKNKQETPLGEYK